MQMHVCIGLVLLALQQTHAAEVVQGLYIVVKEAPAVYVERADGPGQMKLRELVTAEFRDPQIRSTSNDNSSFTLTISIDSLPSRAKSATLALVVAGRGMAVSSWPDRTRVGATRISARIEGAEHSDMIAAALGVKPKRRSHPGHKLLTTFTPSKSVYRVGEEVPLVMTVRNVGETTVCFTNGGSQRGPRNNQFSFIARAGSGHGNAERDVGDPTHFGGLMSMVTLKSGETFSMSVDVTDWFDFAQPDTYVITGLYTLTLNEPGKWVEEGVWDDVATGKCSIQIEPNEPLPKALPATRPAGRP